MKVKHYFQPRPLALGLVLVFCMLLIFGCNVKEPAQLEKDRSLSDPMIVITGNGVIKESRISIKEMLEIPNARYEHVYSIINNWPVKKKFVAKGVNLTVVLKAAGIKAEAKCITIKGQDGYECSFTREQLLETKRYYFPDVMEGDPARAELVSPIIAYEYMEGSEKLSEAKPDSICFIMPQANVNEQTQQCFVKGINEIIVSVDDPGKWAAATAFPADGKIAKGDKVKPQHKEIGKVKMYYTLDDSTPTEKSALYNTSTYQPELNKPIVIDKDTIVKVLVKGFGKYDSDIAQLHYQVK